MKRYSVDKIQNLVSEIFQSKGILKTRADVVAEGLVVGEMCGIKTHGLALVEDYVDEINNGDMKTDGNYTVVHDAGACATWDGHFLPGIWLTNEAVRVAQEKANQFGIGCVTIKKSHHIANLMYYLLNVVKDPKIYIVLCSDPSDRMVVPYGGTDPVMTPNPMAFSVPSNPHPIFFDASTSITTAAKCSDFYHQKKNFDDNWLMDSNSGNPSNDPSCLIDKHGGILTTGGMSHGYKGYGLSLLVEALTQGLGGFGRVENESRWGASVTTLVINPDNFSGIENLVKQISFTSNLCLESKPANGFDKVVLPGHSSWTSYKEAQNQGVLISEKILSSLEKLIGNSI